MAIPATSATPDAVRPAGKAGRSGLAGLGALLPLAALLILVFFVPIMGILWDSVSGAALDLSRYRHLFAEPLYLRTILRTFEVSFYVTLICLGLGYPFAYLLTTLKTAMLSVVTTIILIPLFTAFLIRTYAWMIIMGRQGIINTALMKLGLIAAPLEILHTPVAVYIGMAHVLMPIAIFTMYAVMARIDLGLVRAAAVLGADPVRVFLRVYLPLSLPGVLAAGVLVFIMSTGFYITPALLGGPAETMISQLIVTQATELLNLEMSYALAVILLVATLAFLTLASRFVPLELMWSFSGGAALAATPGQGARWRGRRAAARLFERALSRLFGRWRHVGRVVLPIYGALLTCFFVAPLIVVVILSFSSSTFLIFPPPGFSWRWYEKLMAATPWHSAFGFSIELGLAAAIIAVAIGTAAAFALVRGRLPGKRAIFLLAISPMMIPTIILSIALYVYFARLGILGTFSGLLLGHVVLTTPYAIIVMTSAVRGLDQTLEHAAAVHGARPLQVFRRVILPVLRPALLTGGLLAFLTSFDELLVSIFLLGRQTQTLPLKFWSDINMQIDPLLSAASSLIVLMVTLVIVAGQVLRGRRQRRVGL